MQHVPMFVQLVVMDAVMGARVAAWDCAVASLLSNLVNSILL